MFNSTDYDSMEAVFSIADKHSFDEFNYEIELEWITSMIRHEHPYMSEDDIEILAQCRYETGYYDGVDF